MSNWCVSGENQANSGLGSQWRAFILSMETNEYRALHSLKSFLSKTCSRQFHHNRFPSACQSYTAGQARSLSPAGVCSDVLGKLATPVLARRPALAWVPLHSLIPKICLQTPDLRLPFAQPLCHHAARSCCFCPKNCRLPVSCINTADHLRHCINEIAPPKKALLHHGLRRKSAMGLLAWAYRGLIWALPILFNKLQHVH